MRHTGALMRVCRYPMMVSILLLCFFPGIATWLPDHVMTK